jgi:DNA-binding HxlR family transcriptional regulator
LKQAILIACKMQWRSDRSDWHAEGIIRLDELCDRADARSGRRMVDAAHPAQCLLRFEDFRGHLGIATNVLASRLEKLVEVGILRRERSPDDGRAYDYRLTEKGLALYPVLVAMTDWGEQWAGNPKGARVILRDRRTRKPVERVIVRSGDGRPLGPFDVIAQPGPGADERIRTLLNGAWRVGRSSKDALMPPRRRKVPK